MRELLCGDGTVLYPDCGGGDKNLHRIKLHRAVRPKNGVENWGNLNIKKETVF